MTTVVKYVLMKPSQELNPVMVRGNKLWHNAGHSIENWMIEIENKSQFVKFRFCHGKFVRWLETNTESYQWRILRVFKSKKQTKKRFARCNISPPLGKRPTVGCIHKHTYIHFLYPLKPTQGRSGGWSQSQVSLVERYTLDRSPTNHRATQRQTR